MIRMTLQSALCLLLSPMLVAQQMTDESARGNTSNMPPQTRRLVLEKGTQIEFVTREEISSAKALKGEFVTLEVARDVTKNDTVIVPAGTPAVARVVRVKKAVIGKRNGHIEIAPASMTLKDGTRAKLRRNAPGEDSCGDFGPCWAMFAIMGPLIVAFSPLIILQLAADHHELKRAKPCGKEYTLPVQSRVWGYTDSIITSEIRVSSSDSVSPNESH